MTAVPSADEVDPLGGALLDAYPDAVLLVDTQGRIVRANGAAAVLLGYPPEELLRLNVEALVPHAARAHHVGKRDAYQQAPTRRPMGLHRELSARCRDGSEIMVEIALSPVQSDGESLPNFVRDGVRAKGPPPDAAPASHASQALRG